MVELDGRAIRTKINALNRQRISRVIGIFMLVHLAHFVFFWPYRVNVASPTELWRNQVILAHGTMLAFLILLWPTKFLLERPERRAPALLATMPEVAALVYLLGGAALAIIDQRVTTSITPLITAAVGVPLVFVMRPAVALGQYLFVLLVFVVGVAWVQPNADLLLTTRINSLTIFGLGFGLAWLQWRNQTQSLRQQHRIEEQQRELETKNRELMVLATRDALTGLLNRAQFDLEVDRVIGGKGRACLVMADVDHFKQINDSYGHPVGDGILQEVAGILRSMLRPSDLCGRMGGEEFAILLPETALPEGIAVAERLCTGIAGHQLVVGGESIRITVSFGVAELQAGQAQSYRAADLALYQAKKDGRNCVRSFDFGAGLHQVAISSQPPESD